MAKRDELEFTGERYVPEAHGSIELEHIHRYLQAAEIAKGLVVLDIASGEGYGTAMLAERASRAIGVDVSAGAIQHARSRYDRPNLEYLVGDCAAIPLRDKSVDLVVSFETIEHHDQHRKMLEEIKRVLRPDGVLLISSPDKQNYSIEPGYSNPFHVRELYAEQFKELMQEHFTNVSFFCQRIIYGSGIFPETESTKTRSYFKVGGKINEALGLVKPMYWIALASQSDLPILATGLFEQPIDESDLARSLVDTLTAREREIGELKTAMRASNENLVNLSNAIAEYEKSLKAKDADLNRYEQQAQTYVGELRQYAAQSLVYVTDIQRAQAELVSRDQAIERLVEQVKAYEEQAQSFAEQLRAHALQSVELTIQVTEQLEQIGQLRSETAARGGLIESQALELKKYEEQAQLFQRQLQGCADREREIEERLQRAGAENISNRATMEAQSIRLRDCEQESQSVKNALSASEATALAQKSDLARLQAEIGVIQQQSSECAKTLQELRLLRDQELRSPKILLSQFVHALKVKFW
jgi:SAM-dependent methyltransferase